jgi:pyruvate kinase
MDVPFSAAVSLPELVTRLQVGDRFRYDDGKLEGEVESVDAGEAIVRIGRAKGGGVKLKPEKGINLPDTALGLSPLTAKDHDDLVTVIELADMIGYSFVSRPEDIDLLEAFLAAHDCTRPIGVVAKIERPDAVKNLPDLIARAQGAGNGPKRPFGVMIARGDLAAELGFERLAEMQEEILWICEAASVPAIWATQVLEGLVKDGIPSRGEMTDAAMAARAECVMLNKGAAVGVAVEVLDGLLTRMDAHLFKKTPTLRALKSW